MATVRGCELPEDLYYLIDKHVWVRKLEGNLVRLGMTSVAAKLAGGTLNAVTVSARKIGREIAQGKSVATLESSKFVGPVPAPVSGVLVRGNDRLEADPNLAATDPYGEGWIAEVEATSWDAEVSGLATGPEGVAAYGAKLEADGVSCD
ncbi:MAG TPA: glycine cleavage system protein H [Actinomycetota bacterium]|nr:glycine cleavage system protein H [Actinomycetota bacterium]